MKRQTLREALKRSATPGMRRLVERARAVVGQPPIDDAVLVDYAFAADAEPAARLTLLIPDLTRALAFGGINTGLDLFAEIGRHLGKRMAVDLRILLTDPTRATDPAIAHERVTLPLSVETFERRDPRILARRNEIFIAFNWWAARNIRPVVDAQAEHYARAARPMLYLLQDYEPQMLPFSSAHVLAREALDLPERLWGIFNGSLLREWFAISGHEAEREFVFEPFMPEGLKRHLPLTAKGERQDRLLVYGRPGIPRNCWPALLRGLERFTGDYPAFAEWEIVSVGSPHEPVRLSEGRTMRAAGKLSLDEYAALMSTSRAGVSLMASPHPSYPPLEMAHFGLRTVTNAYAVKDLADFHPNILSTPSIDAAPLAAAIAEACGRPGEIAAPPNAGYLRDDPLAIAGTIAAALDEEFRH
jgi:O-antigen biosynthesis protein